MKGPAVLWYTILRLLLIAVPLAILLALRVNFVISAFAATFIGLCLSYILLAKLRHQVAGSLYDRLHRAKPARSEDDDVEDAFVDAALLTQSSTRAAAQPEGPDAPAAGGDARPGEAAGPGPDAAGSEDGASSESTGPESTGSEGTGSEDDAEGDAEERPVRQGDDPGQFQR